MKLSRPMEEALVWLLRAERVFARGLDVNGDRHPVTSKRDALNVICPERIMGEMIPNVGHCVEWNTHEALANRGLVAYGELTPLGREIAKPLAAVDTLRHLESE